MATGGSDNHIVLADVAESFGLTGRQAESALRFVPDVEAAGPHRTAGHRGRVRVVVDSHGAGVLDDTNTTGPLTERAWDNDLYRGIHYGSLVPGPGACSRPPSA